jgi:hypothetical protein
MKEKVIFVSNSPTVLNKELGDKIDNFDVVIRCNDFEIEGYEKHVGTKTDIWSSCSGGGPSFYHHPIYRITKWMEYHKDKLGPFKEVWTVREQRTDNLFEDNKELLKYFTTDDTQYRFLHKHKNERGKLEFVSKFVERNCKKLNCKSPSTGFITILKALELYGDITIYGNSFFKDRESMDAKKGKSRLGKHYFTMDVSRYKGTKREKYFLAQLTRENHHGFAILDYETENKIVNNFIKEGKITILE